MGSRRAEIKLKRRRNTRHFLFLQGLASPFLSCLAADLRERGDEISRINFCPGDELHWRCGSSISFRGRRSQFGEFFVSLLREKQPTDLILFGDSRPLHRLAIKDAQAEGLRVHVFEEGYLRPDWVTLERGGVNGSSPLPKDPDWYVEAKAHLDAQKKPESVPTPLWLRAAQDMSFHLANMAAPLTYRHYRTHRPRPPALEYAGWAWRFARFPTRASSEQRLLETLLQGDHPTFFLPLQLTGDSQLVRYSPFGSVGEVMEKVIRSFARNAPRKAKLLIKNHPLDTGFDRHEKTANVLSRKFGVEKRVHFLESGHLPDLLKRVQGTVVVNSTVGLVALSYGCPVKALGEAIYRMPGLTHIGALDEFWTNHSSPDMSLVHAFREVVKATTQVNGNFFTRQGIRLAVGNCAPMLRAESPLQNLQRKVAEGSASRRP